LQSPESRSKAIAIRGHVCQKLLLARLAASAASLASCMAASAAALINVTGYPDHTIIGMVNTGGKPSLTVVEG
jgi:hypothetical protein